MEEQRHYKGIFLVDIGQSIALYDGSQTSPFVHLIREA